MKRKILFFSKVIVFIVVLLLVLSKLSLILSVYGYGGERQDPDRVTTLFYELPKDSVDVLFLGDSHSYCTYINQDIFDEIGVSSASLATSACSTTNMYWQLIEALKTQNIKILIMETDPFESSFDNGLKEYRLGLTSGISMIPDTSINKYYNYKDIKQNGIGRAKTLTVFDVYQLFEYKEDFYRRYGTGIKEILNLLVYPAKEFRTFGYYQTNDVHEIEEINTYKDNQTYLDFTKTVDYQYFIKIYDLCREKGIELILSRAMFESKDDLHCVNEQIDKWAKDNEVPVIDYFKLIDECGFDLSKDFRDEGHFNYYGAKKATAYLIDYLKSNYELENHKGDSKYALWEDNDFDYSKERYD